MERNWRVVMMVAKSSAPNSRMVYRMQSCPQVDAADRTRTSLIASGWFLMNWIAAPLDESEKSQNEEITAEQKVTQSIWLYVSIWYPLNNLSRNVDVTPSNPRYPSISAMP